MYASNKERGTNIMLQTLMVSEVMVTTFIWGHTEVGVSKGNIYTESLSLVYIYTLTPPPPRGSVMLLGADGCLKPAGQVCLMHCCVAI